MLSKLMVLAASPVVSFGRELNVLKVRPSKRHNPSRVPNQIKPSSSWVMPVIKLCGRPSSTTKFCWLVSGRCCAKTIDGVLKKNSKEVNLKTKLIIKRSPAFWLTAVVGSSY